MIPVGHAACGECRASMLKANETCPWCRDEVVWRVIHDFLDTIKGSVKGAGEPQVDYSYSSIVTAVS